MVDSTGVLVDSFDLASLPGAADLWAWEINNQGQIVGFQQGSDSAIKPLVWASPQSLPEELPIPGYAEGQALALNDEGVVVGRAWNEVAPGEFEAALIAWKIAVSGSDITVLNTQPIVTGLEYLWGVHLANTGYVTYYDQNSHAFRLVLTWDGLQLSEVVGSRTQLFDGSAHTTGVNDQGTVCGQYYGSGGPSEAFAMTVAGHLLVLPTLPGGKERGQTYEIQNRHTTAVNNNNQLVGVAFKFFPSTSQSTDRYDVILNVGGQAVNLESLVSDWQDYSALDINDAGWVIGKTSSGAVVLIP
jgi:hypothetical protein